MSDDLERRLGEAFHRGSLPPAPPSLLDALRRVPDAPVAGRHARVGRSRFGLLVAAVVLVAGGVVAVVVGSSPRPAVITLTPATPAPSPGLASAIAGLRLEFVAKPVAGATPTSADMAAIVTVVKSRLASAGIVDPTVTIEGSDTVVVELPGVTDSHPISMLLGHAGEVAFVPLGSTQVTEGDALDLAAFPPLLTGDAIASASVGSDQNGRPAIDFVLTAAGARAFGAYTAANIGDYLAITLDGFVVSAPVIQNEIRDGQVQITGGGLAGFGPDEAAAFVAILKSDPLPFPLELRTSQVTEGPSPSAP